MRARRSATPAGFKMQARRRAIGLEYDQLQRVVGGYGERLAHLKACSARPPSAGSPLPGAASVVWRS